MSFCLAMSPQSLATRSNLKPAGEILAGENASTKSWPWYARLTFLRGMSAACCESPTSTSPCPWPDRGSVPEGLTGFEHVRDAFLRFLFTAERDKGFAFQIEQILFADSLRGSERASG